MSLENDFSKGSFVKSAVAFQTSPACRAFSLHGVMSDTGPDANRSGDPSSWALSCPGHLSSCRRCWWWDTMGLGCQAHPGCWEKQPDLYFPVSDHMPLLILQELKLLQARCDSQPKQNPPRKCVAAAGSDVHAKSCHGEADLPLPLVTQLKTSSDSICRLVFYHLPLPKLLPSLYLPKTWSFWLVFGSSSHSYGWAPGWRRGLQAAPSLPTQPPGTTRFFSSPWEAAPRRIHQPSTGLWVPV